MKAIVVMAMVTVVMVMVVVVVVMVMVMVVLHSCMHPWTNAPIPPAPHPLSFSINLRCLSTVVCIFWPACV